MDCFKCVKQRGSRYCMAGDREEAACCDDGHKNLVPVDELICSDFSPKKLIAQILKEQGSLVTLTELRANLNIRNDFYGLLKRAYMKTKDFDEKMTFINEEGVARAIFN